MLRLEGIIPVRTKDRHLIDRLKILPNHELHLNQTSGRSLVTEFEYQHRIERKYIVMFGICCIIFITKLGPSTVLCFIIFFQPNKESFIV